MRENFQGLGVNIAVVGATGAVGKVLFEVLEERNFPTAEIRPLASRRSVGRKIRIGGVEREVLEARPEAFEGIDLVFFAATGALSRELAPEAVARGAIVIDKSNTWRMDA
ncbi:MAG: aspartate-semialdehyde dehydrogenase, partial [Deltaproteobacteria bacterium]|nr:aspartate-semialdehyde dehydrogenase [Deltaproteobacteria bacterium]